jgi:beta-lactamase regulating signal transducer with metallopeptidase domain
MTGSLAVSNLTRQRTLLSGLVTSTALVATCMAGPPALARSVGIAALSTAGLALLLVGVSVLGQAVLHWRLARALYVRSRAMVAAGFAIRVIPGAGTPFVAGLYHPTIYCPEVALRQLTSVELAAVLAHESWHQRSHAPARLLVVGALERLAGPVPWIRMQLEMARAKIEVDADRYAITSGARRSTLASALLALPATPTFANAAGFHSAAELRVRALLGDGSLQGSAHANLRWVLSVGMLTIGCLAYFLR